MIILIIGLLIFLGIHSVNIFAPTWRAQQVVRLGEKPWKGLYSLIAVVGLVLMIWGFALARPDAPIIYEPMRGLKHLTLLLMLLSFISISIASFPAGRLKPILKHPMLLAVKLWAFGHLLANGDLASILLFGTVLVWAVLDRISVKRRGVALPVAGKPIWDVVAILVAILVYLLFIWHLHAWLIGVSPL